MSIEMILLCLGVDYVIGCTVLASIDRNDSLYRWVWRAPYFLLSILAVLLWPVTAAHYLFRKP